MDNEIDIEDLIEREECTYTLTHCGYIKRVPTAAYRAQRRGGRGVNAMATREEDYAETLFIASSHDNILLFSSFGKVYRLKGYQIPETGRTAKGTNVVNLLQLDNGETVSAMFAVNEYDDSHYLFFVTERGVVKRVALSELKNIRRAGLRALSINEGDRLVDVRLTDGKQNILLVTAKGRAICFDENEVRAMGRTAVGVRGISSKRVTVSSAACAPVRKVRCSPSPKTATANAHRSTNSACIIAAAAAFSPMRSTKKTGNIAGTAVVDLDNDVMLITDDGVLIRTAVEDIRLCGRNTQGVIVMRTGDDVHVNAITRIEKEEDEDTELPAETDAEEMTQSEQPAVEMNHDSEE